MCIVTKDDQLASSFSLLLFKDGNPLGVVQWVNLLTREYERLVPPPGYEWSDREVLGERFDPQTEKGFADFIIIGDLVNASTTLARRTHPVDK